jgi:dCTP deaminase
MILVDHQIADLCRGKVPEELQFYYSSLWADIPRQCLPMVEPFDPSLINPASLDIRIGETAKLRTYTNTSNGWRQGGYNSFDISNFSQSEPYFFQPGDRLLVASLETINLPNFLCAQFRLKSSRGREWYEHMEAGFVDPGFHGSKLTMEIINMDCEPLPIYPGLKMGQLIFSLTLGIPDKDYSVTGRYNGDKTVEASKG